MSIYISIELPLLVTWDNFGYVLYSKGSDNSHVAVSNDGILDATLRQNSKNADNIYAGE